MTGVPTTPQPVTMPTAPEQPGLVVVTGAPGVGRTTLLTSLASAAAGTVFRGGGLASLRHVPGVALSRAIRARLPESDVDLAVEAVRARVKDGLLVLDDLQWADGLTLAVLPRLTEHVRVLAALRTPNNLPAEVFRALRAAARAWVTVPPLTDEAASGLAEKTAPELSAAAIAAVVERAGGMPLAVQVLARRAVRAGGNLSQTELGRSAPSRADDLERAIADAVAQLRRPARTAIAALGLLGRPELASRLGPGVGELVEAGLAVQEGTVTQEGAVAQDGMMVAPVAPCVAEIAAGILPAADRAALHARLAQFCAPAESARHYAAAGAAQSAFDQAVVAAGQATTDGERAASLLLAAGLTGVDVPPRVRLDAVAAALAVGRYHAAVRALESLPETNLTTPALRAEQGVLKAEAFLQAGDPAAALAATEVFRNALGETAGLPVDLLADLHRVRILAAVGVGDAVAVGTATAAAHAHFGDATAHPPAVAAALAIAAATGREAGWAAALDAAAKACEVAGRTADERWCRWVLAETLAADGDTSEAGPAAKAGAQRCAVDGAYSWESRFVALGLWVSALRGEALDDVVRRATDLLDRSLPGRARAYALAAGCLAAADSGALGLARGRLSGGLPEGMVVSGVPAEALAWVGQEVAWLDGVVEPSGDQEAAAIRQSALLLGLAEITEHWTAYERAAGAVGAHAKDTGRLATALQPPAEAAAATLRAWNRAAGGWPSSSEFNQAASAWHQRVVREEIRALLGVMVAPDPPDAAVPALLAAEIAAETAGLVVLLGRVRKALRRYVAHGRVAQRNLDERPRLGPRSSPLSARETEVLQLVAQGESTRRIATRLGLSRETVETHVRSGMRKLGARTRTEAAALVAAELGDERP
ncbi:hypothetical protein GCM10009765_49600 [Fodinicola feengrottensis]|uniref:HTH luxR-type domain-containing protein n=2 Tax=Fodinicola feengrottensis TaxID=435914 RepID=A0ABP4TYL1_9ACTN